MASSADLTIMIVGAGAREHVLSAAYERSPQVKKIVVAPGNDFIAYNRHKEVVVEPGSSLTDAGSFLRVARKHKPDLVEVAQDDALAAGTVNVLQEAGFRVFGPTREAARLEWDKRWSREFMVRHNIPTPEFRYFDNPAPAKDYVESLYDDQPNRLLYIKATGLAGGKGALRAETREAAFDAVDQMETFGDAGETFLVEEGLTGEEFSYYAISDGTSFQTFKSAQDNKTVFDGDQGDQTGGMGVVAPALVTKGKEKQIESSMIAPVIAGMHAENIPYTGVLYLGGMVTPSGLKNIEYNARWGDPECQTIIPGITNDYVDVVQAAIDSQLNKVKIVEDSAVRVCVVGTSRGYPGNYSAANGKEIFGLDKAAKEPGVEIYSAAIAMHNGKCYANGGRLFSVVGKGEDVIQAREKAYAAIGCISIEGDNLHYRTDIAWRDVDRVKGK